MKRGLRFTTFTIFAFLLVLNTALWAQTGATKDLYLAVNGFEFNEESAKTALQKGADINWRNDAMNGETMLIMAIKGFKEAKIIKFLLDNGADAAIKDESGKTALEWAQQYNIGRNRNGREILAMLEGGNPKAQTAAPQTVKTTPNPVQKNQTAPPQTGSNKTTTPKTTRSKGVPTDEEIKETMEKSFTNIYESHFYGVKNKVTFAWSDSITVGALQTIRAAPKPCYPVKLKVSVTAEDPRDGNQSTVIRGLDSTTGNYKEEIFCFYRDGFGEWDYGTYGK